MGRLHLLIDRDAWNPKLPSLVFTPTDWPTALLNEAIGSVAKFKATGARL